MRLRWRDVVREVDERHDPERVPEDVFVLANGDRAYVSIGGRIYEFSTVANSGPASRRAYGSDAGGLLSPMPGRVRQVLVAEGDRVAKGQVLLVLEAMKMEHAIRSPHDGRVTKLAFAEGDLVDAGAVLAGVSSDSSDSI